MRGEGEKVNSKAETEEKFTLPRTSKTKTYI